MVRQIGTTNGQWIYPLLVQSIDSNLFCCGQAEPSKNACLSDTKGSTIPFPIVGGSVIFNRISGSVNAYDITTLSTTVATTEISTPTATVAALASVISTKREAGVGAGIGGFFFLILLVVIKLLMKQIWLKRRLKKDTQSLERKVFELTTQQNGGSNHLLPQQLNGWDPNELDGKRHLPPQLEGWTPAEIDGASVNKELNRIES
ncbi:hypothetical protein ACLMJK_006798 [Lecanora helva]